MAALIKPKRIQTYLTEVYNQYCDPAELQREIDEKLTALTAALEKRRTNDPDTDTEVDEDGFVVVSKKSRRRTFGELEETSRLAKPGSRPKRHKKETNDFYKTVQGGAEQASDIHKSEAVDNEEGKGL